MIRIIYTLSIIFICNIVVCFAQNKDRGDDVYNTSKPPPPSTTAKIPMVDDTDFAIDDFVKGCIILPLNGTQNGLLRFNGTTVIFKDTLTQKTKRFSAKELKGFTALVDTTKVYDVSKAVIPGVLYNTVAVKKNYGLQIPVDTFKVYADSFIVKSAAGHGTFGDKLVHNSKFVKQLIYGEKVCLYKTTEKMNNAPTMYGNTMVVGNSYLRNIFYFKREKEATYTEIPSGKRAFKKMMAVYIKDNRPLVQAINNDQFKFDQLEQITMIYNQNKVLN